MPLTIRTPRPDELSSLSDLCFRSKAVWGYDAAFMEACRGELTLRWYREPGQGGNGRGCQVAEVWLIKQHDKELP